MTAATAQKLEQTPAIGDQTHGGYFAGVVLIDGRQFGVAVAPKIAEIVGFWGEYGKRIEGADSVVDGLTNTKAMADAGSNIAEQIQAIDAPNDGASPWYIPARDELELCYRHFKPGSDENYCSWRDGENHNSVPPGGIYSSDSPAQTVVEPFKAGGAEAFDKRIYWTSTQYSAYGAVGQDFDDGFQGLWSKYGEFRVRAVRRFPI